MFFVYGLIFVLLIALELIYFRIADKFNIIDKPNERSSHNRVVLCGGGIIFLIGLWVWAILISTPIGGQLLDYVTLGADSYLWFLLAVTLVASISFIDDIHPLSDCTRLAAQLIAMSLIFTQLDIMHWEMWKALILAYVVFVGASNVINFMDGINGITGLYTLAALIPLYIVNREMIYFVESSLIVVVTMSDVVFCFFNLRPKGKAKCFAGDVGSIGMAYILLFLIGHLMMVTQDVSYLIFLVVYGVDGVLTICHRIMLHENLGKAHRKHAYQIMANELKIGHVKVSCIYAGIQFVISMGFIYLCPSSPLAHWMYLIAVILVLAMAYMVFMKKYYYLHAEYLASLADNS